MAQLFMVLSTCQSKALENFNYLAFYKPAFVIKRYIVMFFFSFQS